MGGFIMSNREPKKELAGVWRSLHVVIWLIGLYILLSRGQIFPGILVLVAISALYEGFLRRFAPNAFEEQTPLEAPKSAVATPEESVPAIAPNPIQDHRLELLPQVCPNCNAPIRGNEVKWTGLQSANCPYCGTNLPMSKA
jgi:hypothetical protein